ncbi:MAG: S-layer homology domain-containing protein [Patescibacteria group bacterium]
MKKLITLLGFVTYIFGANTAFAIGVGLVSANNEDVNVYPDGVFLDGILETSWTTDASDLDADDVPLPTKDSMVTEVLYIGSNTVFDIIDFDITTAGVSSSTCVVCHHYTAEYYDGGTSDWETLSYTDNTNNFETVGEGTWEFDVPAAWDSAAGKTTVDGQTLYWMRLTPRSTTTITSSADAGEIALRAYNVELTLEDELGGPMEGFVSEDFTVSAGTSNDVAGFRDMEDGVYQFALDTGLSDNNYRITANENGYVDEVINTGVLASIKKTLSGEMQFAHKITIIDNDTVDPITPDTVSIGSVSCTISTSTAYCPASTTQDGTSTDVESVTVTKSGYESRTTVLSSDRDIDADSQVTTSVALTETVATADPTEANLTINVTDEDGDAITSLLEGDFDVSGGTSNAIHAFTNSGSGNYVLSLSIDNSDNSYEIEVSEDGYVAEDVTTGEMTGDGSKSVSLDFGYKLTVLDEDGDTVSGASVKAGDDYGTSCSYLGAGVYGCAVPVGDTDLDYKVTLSDYETEYGEFNSARTDHTDAQVSESVSLTVGESDCDTDFDDIYGHWAEDYITELYCRGVVNGLDDDTFGPSNYASRAEFLKMALLNAGYDVDGASGESFSDVSSGDWFYEYVSFGVEEDIIEGYSDDTFRPNNQINRAEALVITMRIAGIDEYDVDSDWDEFDDVDDDDWYAYAVETAADEGIVEGYSDGDFKPGNPITRAEVAAISVRTYDEYYAD